jgi:hypothetical protein
MPFAMSRCEVQEYAGAQSEGDALSGGLLNTLSVSHRNYLRECYEIGEMTVELPEICSMETGESAGFIVVDGAHDRFFSWGQPAETYFQGLRKYADGYARLWRAHSEVKQQQ